MVMDGDDSYVDEAMEQQLGQQYISKLYRKRGSSGSY